MLKHDPRNLHDRATSERFYNELGPGLAGKSRAVSVWRRLVSAFGADEAGMIDRAIISAGQFFRLEAAMRGTKPDLDAARLAVGLGRKQPPAPPPTPAATAPMTQEQLRQLMRSDAYRRNDPRTIATVEAGFKQLYPGKTTATGTPRR